MGLRVSFHFVGPADTVMSTLEPKPKLESKSKQIPKAEDEIESVYPKGNALYDGAVFQLCFLIRVSDFLRIDFCFGFRSLSMFSEPDANSI